MKGIRSGIGFALLGVVVFGSRCAAAADTVTNKLDELDQKVRALELKMQSATEHPGAQAQDAAVVTAGKDGFALSSADQAFQLKLRVYVDRSIVEVFANDRQAMARTIYPTRPDSLGVSLFSRGGPADVASVWAWRLAPANAW